MESKRWHESICEAEQHTDIEKKLVVAKGKGGTGGIDWDFGVGSCKLLHIGWMDNKVSLYSTRSYIQNPVMNHNEK